MMLTVSTLMLTVIAYNELSKQPEPPTIIVERPPVDGGMSPIPVPKEATVEQAVASITEKELTEQLTYLASDELEGRMSGKRGNVVAAEYIKKKFHDFGLPTMYHKFPIERRNPGPKNETGDDFTQNIYAWIEGNDPVLKDEIVVIGAHMDHIGYGPSMSRAQNRREVHNGADDNGSGTVGLLEIAQAFSMLKSQVKRTVVFQAYSAEEMGLIGSRFYCNNPTFPQGSPSIQKHVAMVNLDMVGYLGKGEYFVNWSAGESSIDIGKYVEELNGKYSFAKQITSRGSGGSDHASFYNKRIPVAFLHTGLHPYYHTPDDDVDKINFAGIEKVARYGFELGWKICQAEKKPTFNHAAFKVMNYDHDQLHIRTMRKSGKKNMDTDISRHRRYYLENQEASRGLPKGIRKIGIRYFNERNNTGRRNDRKSMKSL